MAELYEATLGEWEGLVTVKKPSSLGRLTMEWQEFESAFENQVDILGRVFSR